MRNQVFVQEKDQLQTLLSQYAGVGIVVGQKQTLDTMGAALSLYLALYDAGKQVQIVSSVDPIVELSNLVGIDQVKNKFEGDTKTLVISVPYKEGEVEKVSFTTEADRMNFNIVGGPSGITPFDVSDIRLIRKGSSPELIIAVGVPNLEELQAIVDTSNAKVVNIDVNPANSFYGDVIMVDTGFSSISEIIASTIDELGFPLDVDTAQNMLDGINYVTHNFSSPKTSFLAFEAAGILMRAGAQRKQESRRETREEFDPMKHLPQQKQQQSQPQRQQQAPKPQPVQNQQGDQKFNEPELTMANGSSQDNLTSDEVPSDWFVPKVFKGSKNPNQQ